MALPLYHIFALTASLTFMKIGAASILITNPRDIPGFVKELSRQRFTILVGVNTLFNALLHNPDFAQARFHTAETLGRRGHVRPARRRGTLEGRHRQQR